ncbi:MAG: L-aspartate oxidase [Bacillota bacterium]
MTQKYLVNFDTRELPWDDRECLVIGSGLAGLYTALAAANKGIGVLLLTKQSMLDSSTDKAQGGIAAALGSSDSPLLHLEDTLVAGAGLCDLDAVEILVNEGPGRVEELIRMGARFDRVGGELALTREGAHSRRRILHARGDATGAEIQRVLTEAARAHPDIEVLENDFAIDLLVRRGHCYGILACDRRDGRIRALTGRAVILCTGGLGQLFDHSTNPDVATGDGIAMAYRAGTEVMDMEFVQFHPTVLLLPGAPRFLISEAVRGEGAYLRNSRGERFMPEYHGQAELAPRDVVVRAILKELARTGKEYVYLDLSHLERSLVLERFPNINKTCAFYGLDITRDPLPVAPAAHYMMGGVKTNLYGETNITGLYACGEVACPGVHGANRLASNSLLDGLVFGGRIVDRVNNYLKNDLPVFEPIINNCLKEMEPVDYQSLRRQLQCIMGKFVGPVRCEGGLRSALDFFEQWSYLEQHEVTMSAGMEVHNMLLVGQLIAEAALLRTESRGGHSRSDFPNPLERWRKHLILKR